MLRYPPSAVRRRSIVHGSALALAALSLLWTGSCAAAEPPAAAASPPPARAATAADRSGAPEPAADGWARAVGGANRELGTAVAVGADGATYVAGHFKGEITAGPAGRLRAAGVSDAFVARLDGAGRPEWVRAFGGDGAEEIKALAVAPDGRVWAAGFFSETARFAGVPAAEGLVATSAGSADAMLFALEPDGRPAGLWSFGGPLGDVALDVAPAADGRLWVAGYFQGTADLDPGAGRREAASAGRTDAVVLELAADGALVRAIPFGGPGADEASAVAPLAAGGAVVAGRFEETVEVAGARLASAGRADALAVGLGADGEPAWARRLGGAGADQATAVVAGTDGGATVVGRFVEAADTADTADEAPEPGAASGRLESTGRSDGFLWRLGADGATLALARFGGPGEEFPFGLAVRSDGNVVAGGFTQHPPDPAANRGPQPTSSWVVELAAGAGSRELSRRTFTSTDGIQVLDLALAADGSVRVGGTFQGEARLELGPPASDGATAAIAGAGKTDAFAAAVR